MQMNLPAISGLADLSNARVVLYQSGQFVHGPYGTGLVSYLPQPLTPAQQAQVQANLGITASDTIAAIGALTGAPGSFIRFDGPDDDDAVMQPIVGTVSQSGGIPTGSIIERGSNANGEYVRYADGTLICTHTVTGISASSGAGNIFTSGSGPAWTFPSTFAVSPAVYVSVNEAQSWGNALNVNTTGCEFRRFRAQSSGTGVACSLTAIGRWF